MMEMDYGVLGEDILVEIFKRLPKKYQFRFRCVSKGWLHLLSDRTRISPTKTDTGLLLLRIPPPSTPPFPRSKTFLRVLNEDGSAAFIDHSLGFSSEVDLGILDLCNGLFLLGRRDDRRYSIIEYVVFNPATKRSVRIPNPSKELEVRGHGFAFDGHNYHVVHFHRRVLQFLHEKWDFHIFSSQTGEWDEKHLAPLSVGRGVDDSVDLKVVGNYTIFLRGAIHWVLKNSILIYHLKGAYFKLINLPDCNGNEWYQRTWHSEGCLYFCRSRKDGIRIWVLHMEFMDYPRNLPPDVEWTLKHDVVLTALMPEWDRPGPFIPRAFNDDFETVYLACGYRFLSYKLKTRVLKDVCISNIREDTVVYQRAPFVYPFAYYPVHDFPEQVQFPKQPRIKKECR